MMLKYLSVVILYLIILSSVITFVVYEESQAEISGIELPVDQYHNYLTFGTNDSMSHLTEGRKLTTSLHWTETEAGYVFQNSVPIRFEDIFIKGVQRNQDGVYSNTYTFSNPEQHRFRFWIYQTGLTERGSIVVEFSHQEIQVREILGYVLIDRVIERVSYDGIPTGGSITTEYHPTTGMVRVYDGETLLLQTGVPTKSSYNYLGGIGIFGNSFTLHGIQTIVLESPEEVNILTILGMLLIWNVDPEYFPNIFNVILIKFPLLIVTLAIAFYIRGVS